MMTWIESDLAEFFEAPAAYHDESAMFTFKSVKCGVRLEFSVVPDFGDTYVGIWHDGWESPLVNVERKCCSHAQIVSDASGRKCLEVGRTKHPVTQMGIPPVLHRGFRVRLDPQICIELIEPNEERA
jgi:hypothetical protein